ncbi:MAG: putative porin [Nevskia sp.]|nr:putative porin [Nevskia sp.]
MFLPRPRSGASRRRLLAHTLIASAGWACASAALADTVPSAAPPAAAAPAAAAPQETVTEELIRLLAEHNALSKDDAAKLIKRLQDEQAAARQPAPAAAPTATAQQGAAPAPDVKGRVRVIYLPESEKQKIRDEVKQEVIATAKAENWALPNSFPEWVKRLSFYGDLRLREEFDLYDSQNNPFLINFSAINTGAPFNVSQTATNQPLPPLFDTTVNREQPRISLHVGMDAKVADDLTASLRFSTGNNVNPVSTNQTLGNDFNKYTFVVDRAYLSYRPLDGLVLMGGRMPNPFQSTSMMWYWDLGFDGFVAQYHYELTDDLRPYATVGAFSVENTALDFPQTDSVKVGSRDKWLFAAQLGADWSVADKLKGKGGVAFYDFYHLEGELSSPCQAPTSAFSCNSDDSRSAFMQKGNTLFAIRNLLLQQPTDPQFQYFGLASPFRIVNAVVNLDYGLGGPLHLVADADFADNIAFKKGHVLSLNPVNNYGGCSGSGCQAPYIGGNQAYLVQVRIGYPATIERWQWAVTGGYRHVESDSVVDAFNDPDFYIGGTNAKGYHLVGNLGFTHNAWFSARWFSGTEIAGPPLAIDVVQLDLNSRF